MHAYFAIKEYTSVKHISEISPLTRMPLSHEYRVEECGRTQKLRGPGGEGAVCEFCNRYFPSENIKKKLPHPNPPKNSSFVSIFNVGLSRAFATSKECSKHVEVDKVCRRRRRQQRRSVRERVKQIIAKKEVVASKRVKQIIASNDEDSGISMEEEEERGRLPVKIMINLAKKEVVASKSSKEAKTVARSWSERLPRIESQNSTPSPQITSMSSPNLSDSTPMVKIKTEILNDLATGIKSEPGLLAGEEPRTKSAASGIRVALEKTRGRRFLFFFVFFFFSFSSFFYRLTALIFKIIL